MSTQVRFSPGLLIAARGFGPQQFSEPSPSKTRPQSTSSADADYVKSRLFRWFDLPTASVRRDMARLLPAVNADAAVIDVGCGVQPYRSLLPPTVDYLGVDQESARAHFGYDAPDTKYLRAGQPLPASQASLDVVLCTEVLEHVERPLELLRALRRVLKTGGLLVLTTPFAMRRHFKPQDYWRWTSHGLRLILQEAGFTDVRITARGNAFTVACAKLFALAGVWRAFAPVSVLASLLGRWSLRWADSETDCLGFTVRATSP